MSETESKPYKRITIKKNHDYGWLDDRPTYEEIVATFGQVLAEASDNDYQGDSLYLIENSGRYGIVTFGWGSCSGCDALEACSSQGDINELQDDLYAGIKWFDYAFDVEEYLRSGGLGGSFIRVSTLGKFLTAVSEVI